MSASLVILTGASGSGKTTIARHLQRLHSGDTEFIFFDSIGVPPVEEMIARYGDGYQPGGAWQRAMTLMWLEKVASILASGRSVFFEGQMRLAFVTEALRMHRIEGAHVILMDCNDATRTERLHGERGQPELADENMMGWARYLREETVAAEYEILDSGTLTFEEAVQYVSERLWPN